MTSAPPMKVPSELPRLASTTISNTRLTLFRQNPFKLKTSSDSVSKSLTLGLRIYACAKPANQPAASKGFNEVIGAAINAVKMVSGCPIAMAAPRAERLPFHKIQLTVCAKPADGLAKKV